MTDACPKVMLPICGKEFAKHQADWLGEQGVTEIVYCIGHLGEKVRELGDQYNGIRLRYSAEPEPLGKLDALFFALPLLRTWWVTLYGDSIPLGVNLRAMAQHFLYGGKQRRLMSSWAGIDHGVSFFRRSFFEYEEYPAKQEWLELGSPSGYQKMESYLRQKGER